MSFLSMWGQLCETSSKFSEKIKKNNIIKKSDKKGNPHTDKKSTYLAEIKIKDKNIKFLHPVVNLLSTS